MTWVKICGITNLEDALTAVEAGADALGFVFYEKSPRRIDLETARNISSHLPQSIERVGVLVYGGNPPLEEICREVELNAVQVHFGPASFGEVSDLAIPPHLKLYWASWAKDMVVPQGTAGTFYLPMKRRDAIFVDSGTEEQPGGTGKTFDWKNAAVRIDMLNKISRVVVAGGLTPENVGEAIDVLHPWGVDVSSGVEARPGKKDPDKVRAFIKAVRSLENKN